MLQSPKRAQEAGVVISLSSGKLSSMNKEIQIVYLLVAYIHLSLEAWHRPCSASTHLGRRSVSDVVQLLYITIRTEGVYPRSWQRVLKFLFSVEIIIDPPYITGQTNARQFMA